MRQKELRLIITFRTTSAAIAMERFCKRSGLPGRLIPVPRSITADCGMAWSAPLDARALLEQAADAPEYAGIYEVMI